MDSYLEENMVPEESDEEDESADESNHVNLLKAIDSLADKSKKRHKVGQRSEPSLKVSEFHLSASGDKDERIALHDLVGALQNSSGYGGLKKKLDSMHKKSGVLDVPLPKPEAEKIQRTVAFDETAKYISKWAPTVKKNREAEHLSFPLKPYIPPKTSTRTLAANFKPRTPLEEEIAAVLQGSSHLMERKDKNLSEEEEQALLAMDLEEAKDRRHELQKLRALQSYYEAKCRRTKKIKSKKYHRVKRKAEKRSAMKLSIGDLQEEDPEKAKEELEKAERLHAEERISLKHRNTSKWAKKLMLKGNKNLEARKALQEQLRISRNLTNKRIQSDGEEEEEEEEEEKQSKEQVDDASNNTFGTLMTDQNNPWGIQTKNTSRNNTTSCGEHSAPSSKFHRLQPVTREAADLDPQESGESDVEEEAIKSDDEFELQLTEPEKTGKQTATKKEKKRKAGTEEREDVALKKKKVGKKRSEEVIGGLQGKGKKGKDKKEEKKEDEEKKKRKKKKKKEKEKEEDEEDEEEEEEKKKKEKEKDKKKEDKDKKKKKALLGPFKTSELSLARKRGGKNKRKKNLPNKEPESELDMSDSESLNHDKQYTEEIDQVNTSQEDKEERVPAQERPKNDEDMSDSESLNHDKQYTEEIDQVNTSQEDKEERVPAQERPKNDEDMSDSESLNHDKQYTEEIDQVNTSQEDKEERGPAQERPKNDGQWKCVDQQNNTKNAKEVRVDPNKIFRFEDYGSKVNSSNDVGHLSGVHEERRLNIQQAFANDDVVEEFTREKANTEEAAKPKDVDFTLPGWGDWAGAGLKASQKKKKFVSPAPPAPARKDRHLAHVIISEEKDKRFAKNQVASVPHPYTSQVQFERSIRNPVGKHWNTSNTVNELTKPRVTTLVGTIIEPIKPTKEIKRKKPQEEQEGSTKHKRRRKKPTGSSLTIHN